MKPLQIDEARNIPRAWGPLAVNDAETVTIDGVITPRLMVHLDEFDGIPHVFYNTPGGPTCIDKYKVFLFTRFEGTDVFAHNGSGFDHRLFLARHVLSDGASAELGMSGSAPIIITIQDDEYKIDRWGKLVNMELRLLDSMRLLPTSLRAIGKSVDVLKDEVDRAKIAEMSDEDVAAYCIQDCRVLLAGLAKYREVVEKLGGYYGVSSAGVASSLIRASIPKSDYNHFFEGSGATRSYSRAMLDADEYCTPAYYGGRCEPFQVGHVKRKVYYYDITSAYPWALTQWLPWKLLSTDHDIKLKWHPDSQHKDRIRLRKRLGTCGISDVDMFIPAAAYATVPPVLPTRDKHGRILYATGHLSGRWTNIELKANYDHCKRIPGFWMNVNGGVTFGKKPFAERVIRRLFEERLRAKAMGPDGDGLSQVLKILMNACYGKLAQHPEQSTMYFGPAFEMRCRDIVAQDAEKPRAERSYVSHPDSDLFEHVKEEFGAFRHIAAGAYVTALARLRLRDGMILGINQGAQLMYCDTDSLMFDRHVEGLAVERPTLGEFAEEYIFSEVEILCSKLYRAKIWKADGKPQLEKTWLLRVKGMNVGAQDETLSPRGARVESMQRWMVYARAISRPCNDALTRLELSPERLHYLGRAWAGITSLKRSIKSVGAHVGTWECREEHQHRSGLNPDTCRRHDPTTQTSIPLHLENGDMLVDGRTLDAETESELKNSAFTH